MATKNAEQRTELERVRAELTELERRFRNIIHGSADGMVVVDGEGRIRFANQAAGRLFDREPGQLIDRPFGHALVTGENTEIDVVRSGDPLVAEMRVMETEWEGEAAHIVTLRDVTDRKRAEERARHLIREQVARAEAEEAARRAEILSEAGRRLSSSLDLQKILQSAVDLVAGRVADFCIVDLVSDGHVQRFSAASSEDVGKALVREGERYPLDPESDAPRARVYRDQEVQLIDPVSEEWHRPAAVDDDHLELLRSVRPQSLILAPLFTGRQALGVLTAGCTTARHAFDEGDIPLFEELGQRVALAIENARLYRDVEAANRAKTNFLSVMSHELRTPLSAIMGYADLIDRGVAGEPNDKQREFLGRIRASSNHLLHIIEEILAFAGTEAGQEKAQLEPTTLGQLVQAVTTLAEPLAEGADLDFRVEVDDSSAPLNTDDQKVRQVLLNLVSNAFKFTREGWVALRAETQQDTVVFQVEDTGVGIPEERQEEIFERFWQVEDPMTRRAGGTGLGLSIARNFVRILDGSIAVESKEGEGSTFTVRIPRNLAE